MHDPLNRKLGTVAEHSAMQWLAARGLGVITRNWRCRFGEIDLVLQDGSTIVFAEVRLRSNPRFGGAAASIDARKQAKLVASAQLFLAARPALRALPCRFDAVLLCDTDGNDVEWIRNAFDAA